MLPMKRAPRIALKCLAAASALLFLAVALLWLRSNRTYDEIVFTSPGPRLWQFDSCNGQILVMTIARWPNRERFRASAASASSSLREDLSFDRPQYTFRNKGAWRWHGFSCVTATSYAPLDSDGLAHWSKTTPDWLRDPHPLGGRMKFGSVLFPDWAAVAICGLLTIAVAYCKIGSCDEARYESKPAEESDPFSSSKEPPTRGFLMRGQ
jgi:hypothetical protein